MDENKVSGHVEITVKFNAIPEFHGEKNKTFTIHGSECSVTATVKNKAVNKFLKATEAYPAWVAAISGPIESIQGRNIRLAQAGLVVFEKKVKDKPQAEEPAAVA